MKINSYSFGSITVDGFNYTKDVIIYPDHVLSPWWRKEGHLLQKEDLAEVFKVNPSLLIIGTGYHGTMKVSEATLDYLASLPIDTIVKNTEEAVSFYNKKAAIDRIAAFHLTC